MLALSACAAPGEGERNADADGALEAARVAWVGDTHVRYDGQWIPEAAVMTARPLDVYSQTWPSGAASEVLLSYRRGASEIVRVPMALDREHAGASGDNTQWRATIPPAALDGADVEYWVEATGADGAALGEPAPHRVTPRDEVALGDGGWRMAGRGTFEREGDVLVARPGEALGLYWSTFPLPPDFELSLEFRLARADDNSGVVLRTPDPARFGYENAAWVGVHYGLEVQIDEIARPDGAAVHRTGAIYEQPGQTLDHRSPAPPGSWSRYVIRVVGQTYEVRLDGHLVSRLAWAGDPARPERALPGSAADPRFFGLQAHTGSVAFRDVRLRRL